MPPQAGNSLLTGTHCGYLARVDRRGAHPPRVSIGRARTGGKPPFMNKTIVIGHDGTVAADAALRFAERLAADDARLVITRVVPASRRSDAEAELARVRVSPGIRWRDAGGRGAHGRPRPRRRCCC